MKLFYSLLFFVPIALCAQVQLSERVIDTTSASIGISKILTADFNQDGFEDLATCHPFSDEIAIYLQNGTGNYGPRLVVADSADYPIDITVADLNGDSIPDLVSLSLHDHLLMWYPNQNGSFGTPHIIDSTYVFGVEVIAEDFNNDGAIDLVAADDTAVSYYQNDGSGNFSFSKLAGKTEFYSIAVADINGDSLKDVMLGSVLLYTYINNGNGTFSRDMRNEALINNFIFNLEMADIDGDGDQDVAVYYANNIPDIDWYKNDGTGKFSAGGSITTNSNDVKSMRLVDLTGDGHPDFLTAYGQTGELVWMENDGQGNFSSENVIHTYPVLLRQVAATDADKDGDVDVFCGHNNEGLFFWENLSPTSGLDEPDLPIEIYPNPATDVLVIETEAPCTLRLYSLQGLLLMEKQLTSGKNKISINLPAATYLVSFSTKDTVFSSKLWVRQ